MNRTKKSVGRLHIIINVDERGRPSRSPLELARMAIKGGAETLQYRNKGGAIRDMLADASQIRSLCYRHGVTFIVNDRVDLALAVEADGVHLGLNDMLISAARRILGHHRLIGATVRGVEHLRAAASESADYVGLGPIYRTGSKELDLSPLGLEAVREVSRERLLPVIGIAGITVENAGDVLNAGAYGVAVIGAVASADDPIGVVRQLHELVEQGSRMPERYQQSPDDNAE